jgi:hypothetical protein
MKNTVDHKLQTPKPHPSDFLTPQKYLLVQCDTF